LPRCYHLAVISGIESAKLKVKRATIHIEAIQQHAWEYTGGQPDLLLKEPDGTKKLHFSSQPPPDIAVLAGEVVYQLRSALDHLAFDLVQLNPSKIELPPKWFERCQFPLLTTVPSKGKPPVPYSTPLPQDFFSKSLPGITPNAFAFIEGLQPYYGGNGPTQLGWLAELSNIDKHRHLHIINPQAYQREHVRSPRFDSEVILRLQDGAELQAALHSSAELADAVYMDGGIAHPFVSFDESALGKEATDVPVDNVLQVCADTIATLVIPAFEKLIKQL
jgi:hypothetical protein